MAFDLITVVVLGLKDKKKLLEISLPNMAEYEAKGFNFFTYDNDDKIKETLAAVSPHVIITYGKGEISEYPNLWNLPIEYRKRWLNINPDDGIEGSIIAMQIMNCFISNVMEPDRFKDLPLISVFTPTYKTGDKIQRPYKSLLEQNYSNWEWVIYDDSPDDGKTFNEMCELAKADPRIKVFRSEKPCGIIGEVKRRACMLAKGSILVELDHDDELTVNALYYVNEAFKKFPDAGFAYTDCAEVYDNGELYCYSEGWGFGYGSYRSEFYKGKEYAVTNYPPINHKTIRHIVAAPNHIRAWKKDAYIEIGGHNSDIHVCDDYELCIRTFLKTRMIHIKKLGYIQYYNVSGENASGNTQKLRNKEIQRLVNFFRFKYNNAIHGRFVELGIEDSGYNKNGFNFGVENSKQKANYEYE